MTDERPLPDVAAGTVISGPPPPPPPASDGLPPAPPTPPTPPSKRSMWLMIAGGAVVLALGVWLVVAQLPRFLASPTEGGAAAGATPPGVTAAATGEARRIRATLYYVADDGSELVPAIREVLYGATPAEQARRIVEMQVQAPTDGHTSAIPSGTTVRAVFLARGGEAYVDLGGTIVSGHSGGSLDEALAVYAIINAITVNLPDVTAVQILVEGKEVDTLAGHLDLRAPLGKGLEWVRRGQ